MKLVILFASMMLLAACTIRPSESIPLSIAGEESSFSEELHIANGSTIALVAQVITATINGKKYTMYGYNGQIPGPTLNVEQGSTIFVNFTNHLPEPTTVHWHGLRHDYRNDGMPGISQEPVQPGESFLYELSFPDDGVMWYHPHIREDRQQNLGMYGNIVVEKSESQEHRELIILSDLLLDDQKNIVPYGKDWANFALMGRYGNVLLVNGQPAYNRRFALGQTVRFAVTNAANARPFNISLGLPMRLIGSDLGEYEHESIVENIIIGPAERMIFDVTFDKPGEYELRNSNPWQSYLLGTISIGGSPNNTSVPSQLSEEDIERYRQHFNDPVNTTIILTMNQNMMGHMQGMHSETEIEWEDTMQHMNAMSTSRTIRWIIKDNATGRENNDLSYSFNKGDVPKIRIVNDDHSMHPMQHNIHFHGQRFLVVSENGIPNENLVWKDTVMIPAGSYADLLLDMDNPGIWMLHCHISEHLEAGMMTHFTVGSDASHGEAH